MCSTNKYLITILFTVIAISVSAQARISSYVEKTNISPKLGTTVSYEFGDYTEVGVFYQKAMHQPYNELGYTVRQENEFAGIMLAYPLFVGDASVLKLNARTGIVNKEHFLITPSITGSYFPLSFLSLDLGVGVRNLRPTLQAGLKITLR